MHHRQSSGNVLSEYGLLIGLIAVASVASLNLLGNSLSDGFGNLKGKLDNNYVASILGGPKGGSAATQSGPGTLSSSSAPGLSSGSGNIDTPYLPINLDASTDSNVTSSNGSQKVQAVKNSLSIAQQFSKMAEEAVGGHETYLQWLKDASMHSFALAGGEANYSIKDFPQLKTLTSITGSNDYNKNQDGLAEFKFTQASSIYSLQGTAWQLTQLKQQITTDSIKATPAQKAQALAMMNAQLTSFKNSYGDVINKYIEPDYSRVKMDALRQDFGADADTMAWTIDPETFSAHIQKAAPSIISSGSLDETPAIKTSLQTGLTTSSKATTIEQSTGSH